MFNITTLIKLISCQLQKRPLLRTDLLCGQRGGGQGKRWCGSPPAAVDQDPPQKAAGQRSTDFEDYPNEKSGAYAMRDVNYYISTAQSRGQKQGTFMAELLSGDVPWTYIRQAQALLRLGYKYGATRVETACTRALAFGLMNVKQVGGIIKQSLEKESIPIPTGTRIFTLSPPVRAGRRCNEFST